MAVLRAAGCVFAEEEADLLLAAVTGPDLDALVARRVAGEPLEVLLGWAELCGLRVAVDAGVFVPRRRSELLVRTAVPLLPVASREGMRPGVDLPVVVDLCCGTGALGLAVARLGGPVELHATDVDPTAVRCAARNLEPIGGHAWCGDLDEPLPGALRGRVHVLLANAPYVPSDEVAFMPPEAREHEPLVALDGGPDGVEVQRRVIAAAPGWLRRGGHVLVETSRRQAPLTTAAMTRYGLTARVVHDEDLDATVVVGRLPD